MKTCYDHLYFAPHLDDVVLSCGGQIYHHTAAGESVLIVTVTAADPPEKLLTPYMESLHNRWAAGEPETAQPDNIIALRRAEDIEAARTLGATTRHWPYLDCIYRCHPESDAFLYGSDEALFGPVSPAEATLIDDLAARMAELPPVSRVYLPLGVGNHVDHQIVRAAGERAFGRSVTYYEDYPYAQSAGELEKALTYDGDELAAEVVLLDDTAVAAKLAAILAYQSQLSTFFTDDRDLTRRLDSYGQRLLLEAGVNVDMTSVAGAERLWRTPNIRGYTVSR